MFALGHLSNPSIRDKTFLPRLLFPSFPSGVKFALPKLVTGITRQLFLEDSPQIIGRYLAYNEEEFLGVWPLPQQVWNGSVAAASAGVDHGRQNLPIGVQFDP